jgi:putative transposase
MAVTRYRRTAGAVSTLHCHFMWCPKYRRPVLGGAVAEALVAQPHERAATFRRSIERQKGV